MKIRIIYSLRVLRHPVGKLFNRTKISFKRKTRAFLKTIQRNFTNQANFQTGFSFFPLRKQ